MHANVIDPDGISAGPAGWRQQIAALPNSRIVYALVSLILLAPCFWQPRLQAGDLSSHIYNAWLAQLIESGRADGLVVVRQSTNILFDLILSGLLRMFGAEWAQRVAVSFAVLIFIWGAFAFVSAVAGRRTWHLLPCIAMLAYGWVFHSGFFNFYLSLGLCFWALAITWNLTARRFAFAIPFFAAAYVAHALPVLWTVGLLTYIFLARNLKPFGRAGLTTTFVFAMVLLHAVIGHTLITRWSPAQITMTTGVDQVWVFNTKYYIVLMGLLAMWGMLFIGLLRANGPRQVVTGIPFQICVIGAAGVFILPSTVLIPGFYHALSYIAERMSLGVGICVCALLGAARPRLLERCGIAAVAAVFFCFIYIDERALNSFEDRMQDVVETLPPGQRVVSAIADQDMRVNAVTHMIDRVCIGRCFSYANYEASTGQFRIRAVADNPFVTRNYADSWHLQTGVYIVRPSDVPLYQVDLDHQGRLFIRSLKAGTQCGNTYWKTLKDWMPAGARS
jgi:hypothetical protein